LFVPAQTYVAQMLQTLAEFPPRQRPASFNIAQVMEKLTAGVTSA
jgi:arylsulfatase